MVYNLFKIVIDDLDVKRPEIRGQE